MSPTVAERTQMRRAAALVGIELDRHLADHEARAMRVDNHLRGELHAGRARAHPAERIAGESSHSTMKIMYRRMVKPAGNRRKHRIAEIPMKRRHGARFDAARKAITHDQFGTVLQRVDEVAEAAPVV